MKKKSVRILTAVLAVAAFMCLTACGTNIRINITDPKQQSMTQAVTETEVPKAAPAAEAEDTAGKKVYFAAPLFNKMEKDYNLELVTLLESYGYEVFLPQRDGFLAPELLGLTEQEKIDKIFQKDLEEVTNADIIFAVLDGRVPDEGVCVELGIAYTSGKRCYGIKNDARSVELDMDLNPMITGCMDKIFYNTNDVELLQSLKEYLDENQL